MTRTFLFVAVLCLLWMAEASAGKQPACFVRAGMKGAPAIVVDGRPLLPILLSYEGESPPRDRMLGMARTAHASGIDLICFPIALDWHCPDAEASQTIDAFCSANPNAFFYVKMWMGPDASWLAEHPDECAVDADGSGLAYASIASLAWREVAAEKLRARLRLILDGPYGDRFIGVGIAYLEGGGWFYPVATGLTDYSWPHRAAYRAWLRAKYRSDKRLRVAWDRDDVTLRSAESPRPEEFEAAAVAPFRDPKAQAPAIDFLRFQYASMAEAIAYFAGVAKEEMQGRGVVGVWHGYTFDLPGEGPYALERSGHVALGQLLACKDIDIIHLPYSRFDREIGCPGHVPLAVDSLALHGKLGLLEDDTFLHRSSPLAGDKAPPDRPHRAFTSEQTLALAQRNAGNSLMHRCGYGFVDRFGDEGWSGAFGGGATQLLRRMAAETRAYPFRPEIAVVVDEDAALSVSGKGHALLEQSLGRWRFELDRLGAPVGYYLQSDLERIPDSVKALILVNPYVVSRRFRLDIDRLYGRGVTVVWTYAPGVAGPDEIDWGRIGSITGIAAASRMDAAPLHVVAAPVADEIDFGALDGLPRVVIADEQAHPLARYADSGEIAIAAAPWRGGTSVFSAVPRIPVGLLRWICARAGASFYRSTPGHVAVAGPYLVVHAEKTGRLALSWPSPFRVADRLLPARIGSISVEDGSFVDELLAGTTAVYICE